jgi:hypothetical protein
MRTFRFLRFGCVVCEGCYSVLAYILITNFWVQATAMKAETPDAAVSIYEAHEHHKLGRVYPKNKTENRF